MTGSVQPEKIIAACLIGGLGSWVAAVSVTALLVFGPASPDGSVVVFPVFAAVLGTVMLAMARAIRRDRDHLDAVDRFFESSAVLWGAVLLAFGVVAVIAILVWGLTR